MCGLYACIDMCVEVACMCTMHKYTNEGAMYPNTKRNSCACRLLRTCINVENYMKMLSAGACLSLQLRWLMARGFVHNVDP